MAKFTKSRWNIYNDPLEPVCLRLPRSQRARLRVAARARGLSDAELIRSLLENALEAPAASGAAAAAAAASG